MNDSSYEEDEVTSSMSSSLSETTAWLRNSWGLHGVSGIKGISSAWKGESSVSTMTLRRTRRGTRRGSIPDLFRRGVSFIGKKVWLNIMLLCDDVQTANVVLMASPMDSTSKSEVYKIVYDNQPLVLQLPDLIVWNYEAGVIEVCVDDDPFIRLIQRLSEKLNSVGKYSIPSKAIPGHTFNVFPINCPHRPDGSIKIMTVNQGKAEEAKFQRGTRTVLFCKLEHVVRVNGEVRLQVEALQAHSTQS